MNSTLSGRSGELSDLMRGEIKEEVTLFSASISLG